MKRLLVILLCMAVFTGLAMAQTYAAGTTGGITNVDKLGAHSNGGRGCVGCHAPHSGAFGNGGNAGSGTTTDTNMGNLALWGQDMGPLYGQTLTFAGNTAATMPTQANFSVDDEEILGIMTCLSCHDGNIAKGAMMVNDSWEKRMGLLPVGANGQAIYGPGVIPTLLGNDLGTAAGNYLNDHPVGPNATLGNMASRFKLGTCSSSSSSWTCLQIDTTKDTNGAYQAFVDHYAAPQTLGTRASFVVIPAAATTPGEAYVVCTTCHTPHSMYTFSAGNTAGGKVAGNTSGTYPSYFFINAPYNPGSQPTKNQASSATQFCRQCHFTGAGGSNEGSGIMGVTTAF